MTSSPTPGICRGLGNFANHLPNVNSMVFYTVVIAVLCQNINVYSQTTSSKETPEQLIITTIVTIGDDGSQLGKISQTASSDDVQTTSTIVPDNKALSTIHTPTEETDMAASTPPRMPPAIIRDEAPVINRGPSNETVQIGRKVTLLCRATGNPTPDIKWEKDGHIIPNNGKHYIIKDNHNLRILSASLEDAGRYRCMAVNRIDTVFSLPATLIVEMPVNILSGPANHNVTYGTMVNLTCRVAGYPAPDIIWLRQGGVIRDSEGKSFLYFNATMSANYTCLASNFPETFGVQKSVRSTGQVIVSGRPNFCAPYNGLVCNGVLGRKRVFYNASLLYPPGKMDRSVKDLLLQAKNSVSTQCHKALENLVCHQAYPDCEENSGAPPAPKPLSLEDCKVVKEQLCHSDLVKLRNNKNQMILWGPGEGNLGLPNCDALPSKSRSESTYTDVQLFPGIQEDEVTNDCIEGVGQYYMGTVNTTAEGLLCQPWEAQHPHSHRFYPEVYPELRNASNYCRNPGALSGSGPWCFTLNRDIAWRYCNITRCENKVKPKPTDSNNSGAGIDKALPTDVPKPEAKVSETPIMIIIICVTTFGSICILLVIGFGYRRYQYRKRFANYKYPVFDPNRLPENPLFGKDLSRSYNPKLQYLEFPRNDIRYMRDIGEGAFGRVFQAITPNLIREEEKTVVAIKMLKADAERDVCDYFNREAEIISRFNHPNIIQLLGICFVGKPLCLILEYMGEGDLQEFLQVHHPYSSHKRSKSTGTKYHIDRNVQVRMAQQVARGLGYLAEKHFVHRDIATRNCLVNKNLDVKIADFGLAQYLGENNSYHGNKDETIPIRWTAPEALWQYHFTTFSDVWSFGILLWEIFSYAQQPYASLSHEQVFIQTHQGHQMSCPSNTSASMYKLMQRCWALEPTERPNFHTVVDALNEIQTELEETASASSPDTSEVSIES